MEIVLVDVNKLKKASYNPRKWNKNIKNKVKESIQKFGFVTPLVVNSAKGRENIVIGGHLRLTVAREMGIKEVPVVYVNIPDIEKEKELNIRLNKNTGKWDFKKLSSEFDLDLLAEAGFTNTELEGLDLLKDFDLDNIEDELNLNDETVQEIKPEKETVDIVLTLTKEEYSLLLDFLNEHGYSVKQIKDVLLKFVKS